jgi:hypothetical protein
MTFRPHMPLSVKLQAAVLQLGLDPNAVDFDHDPALGLRVFDATTKTYTPDANDPKFITVRARGDDHKPKTFGNGATTAGSDIHRIAKIKRLEKSQAALERALDAKVFGGTEAEPSRKRPWPKGRKLQSRPFRRVSA